MRCNNARDISLKKNNRDSNRYNCVERRAVHAIEEEIYWLEFRSDLREPKFCRIEKAISRPRSKRNDRRESSRCTDALPCAIFDFARYLSRYEKVRIFAHVRPAESSSRLLAHSDDTKTLVEWRNSRARVFSFIYFIITYVRAYRQYYYCNCFRARSFLWDEKTLKARAY